jgi:hypothetical protein
MIPRGWMPSKRVLTKLLSESNLQYSTADNYRRNNARQIRQ